MVSHAAIENIEKLRRHWTMMAIITNALLAIACTAVVFVSLYTFFNVSIWWIVPIGGLSAVVVFLFTRNWKINRLDVVHYINKVLPQAEESTHLLLKPIETLSFLERLQVKKLESVVSSLTAINPLKTQLNRALFVLMLSLIVAAILYFIPLDIVRNSTGLPGEASLISTKPEVKPAEVRSAKIIITPPANTGKAARVQDRFNMVVEENAMVTWQIETTLPLTGLQLKLNDRLYLPLQSVNQNRTKWQVQKRITQPGFYQVQVHNKLSELYRIEMIKDKPPVIVVNAPASGMVIKSGQPRQFMLTSLLSDDYGLQDARIFATIASGNGEAVKFKEQQITINIFSRGSRSTQVKQLINCKALGMQPGDELYFYVRALDNNNQQTRSDIMIITLEDTAQLMSMDGLVMGLDAKPEFFRSQRQIIIETEQLLKDRDTISVQAYNTKSNELGIDQQVLRLRYGKFLGEESNTEIGGEHDDGDHEGEGTVTFGDANAVLDQFSHKHDIAEDATFFDPETKKQLKATLAEMWKSEGKLRLYKPAEALPFAYNALRLLKDLQQKSRVYVAKTSSKTTPLQPKEKRLTGELDKITQPVLQSDSKPLNNSISNLRLALGVLEVLKNGPLSADKMMPLQLAGQHLVEAASANPARYLSSIEAYKKLMDGNRDMKHIIKVQAALQNILQLPASMPYQKNVAPASNLSTQYFNNLKKGSR